jgi:glycerol-3-phosphate dehydrogenase
MCERALEIDFDVAIIGCGAYGMPLASKLKNAGKQAIHLGGATQLLFGIKGNRWENGYPTKIATFFNDAWVRASAEETPQNAYTVERGCYW